MYSLWYQIVGLLSTCNYVNMSSSWEKPCRCWHKRISLYVLTYSCQSPHPEVGMVSLLYMIVPQSNGQYLYKLLSHIIRQHVVDMTGFLITIGYSHCGHFEIKTRLEWLSAKNAWPTPMLWISYKYAKRAAVAPCHPSLTLLPIWQQYE